MPVAHFYGSLKWGLEVQSLVGMNRYYAAVIESVFSFKRQMKTKTFQLLLSAAYWSMGRVEGLRAFINTVLHTCCCLEKSEAFAFTLLSVQSTHSLTVLYKLLNFWRMSLRHWSLAHGCGLNTFLPARAPTFTLYDHSAFLILYSRRRSVQCLLSRSNCM